MELEDAQAQLRKKRLRLWRFVCIFVVVLLLFPVRNEYIRLALITGTLCAWLGALILFWKRPLIRGVCLLAPTLLALLFLAPQRSPDPESLRRAYIVSLKSYVGTPYIWGGETRTGIDCSGLVRQGIIHAEWGEGLRTLNGALLREAVSLWWDDCSARSLGEEYHGRTMLQRTLPTFNNLNYQDIQLGDLAIVGDGVHVLAYLGDKYWIHPDPQAGWVVITPVPSDDPHLSFDTVIVRWRILIPLPLSSNPP